MKFSHIALNCLDPIALERYYTRYFGFKRARVIPIGGGQQIVFLKGTDGIYLEIFGTDVPRPAELSGDGGTTVSIKHLAFQVDDVDATVAAMGSDAHITLGPLDFGAFIPGWRTTWVADPEGNIVEISQGYVDEDNPPAL